MRHPRTAVALLLLLLVGLLPAPPAAAAAPTPWVPWVGDDPAEVGCTKGSTDPHGICGGHHSYDALDLLLPSGTPVVAPLDGTVLEVEDGCADAWSSCGGGRGNYVLVSGSDGRHRMLAHLRTVDVGVGTAVSTGDRLGTVGRSGYASTPHLHYEERTPDGTRVEPGSLRGRLADGSVVTYPSHLGHDRWYDVPSHQGAEVWGTGILPPSCVDGLTDVLEGNPFCADVAWMLAEGITTGYGDGTYRPLDPVSRQAMAMFLHRATPHGATDVGDPGFSDVDAASAFHHPIAWAVHEGIATGYPDGTFRPIEPISRQAMVALLWRRAGSPAGPFDDPGLVDVAEDHPFATAIGWAAQTGVATGYADGTFRPAAPISRQAMAALLHRAVG